MKTEEANKIIAEFMGWTVLTPKEWSEKEWIDKGEICSDSIKIKYSISLDALVPVWEKLKYDPTFVYCVPEKKWTCSLMHIFTKEIEKGYGKAATIQEAACMATAKAIKELTND